jgi:hypothetical protein
VALHSVSASSLAPSLDPNLVVFRAHGNVGAQRDGLRRVLEAVTFASKLNSIRCSRDLGHLPSLTNAYLCCSVRHSYAPLCSQSRFQPQGA